MPEKQAGRTGRSVVIVGAGPVGLVAAMYLAPRVRSVTVLERRPDPRLTGGPPGRSITVMLSARGWRALAGVGLHKRVLMTCMPIRGRCAHLPDGRTHVTPYSRDRRPIWSVERNRLHGLLLDAAERTPGVEIRFAQRVREVDLSGPAVLIDDGPAAVRVGADLVLGCDGANSVARTALVSHGVRADVRVLELAHQEIDVPGGWLDPSTMHYWPTGDALFAAFPLPNGRFAGSLFMRRQGPAPSYAALGGVEELLEVFTSRFAEPAAAIPDLDRQLSEKRVGTISLVDCDGWVRQDRLALLGDACHAMAPFMGHGMNCGFEDVRVLTEQLEATEDWGSALAAYEKMRVEDAQAISSLSLQHYHTMANPPAEQNAEARERLRQRLFDLFPDRFAPLYERCAFTEESYATVLRDDQGLTDLVDRLVADGDELLDSRLREYVLAADAGIGV